MPQLFFNIQNDPIQQLILSQSRAEISVLDVRGEGKVNVLSMRLRFEIMFRKTQMPVPCKLLNSAVQFFDV